MKYGKNVLIIFVLSSFSSCITQKETKNLKEKETETKTEIEGNKEIYLKKTSENKKLNFIFNLDSLLFNKYEARNTDSSFLFAEVKNGEIKIIYIQPNITEIREEKTKENRKESKIEKKKEKTEKEKTKKNIPYVYIGFGIFFIICGFYIIYEIRKKFLNKI